MHLRWEETLIREPWLWSPRSKNFHNIDCLLCRCSSSNDVDDSFEVKGITNCATSFSLLILNHSFNENVGRVLSVESYKCVETLGFRGWYILPCVWAYCRLFWTGYWMWSWDDGWDKSWLGLLVNSYVWMKRLCFWMTLYQCDLLDDSS